jgi:hypothetical protein
MRSRSSLLSSTFESFPAVNTPIDGLLEFAPISVASDIVSIADKEDEIVGLDATRGTALYCR